MSNSLFNSLKPQQSNSIMEQFSTFQQNPIKFLLNRNIQIPQDLQQDPKGAVQYLLNSGNMTQAQFNKLNSMASQLGIKLT